MRIDNDNNNITYGISVASVRGNKRGQESKRSRVGQREREFNENAIYILIRYVVCR